MLADEIHADLALSPNRSTPFATAAAEGGFGGLRRMDRSRSSPFHLTRNNVFALAAFEAAYREGAGFARMTIASSSATIERAVDQLVSAVSEL